MGVRSNSLQITRMSIALLACSTHRPPTRTAVVTLTGPLLAPLGTVTERLVSLEGFTAMGIWPKRTVTCDAPPGG
jgi:hypothetical protein